MFSRIKSYHWNEKMFYWNKIIPLKQMEKSVPPELFGRGKKKTRNFVYDAVLKNILVIIWDNYFGLTPLWLKQIVPPEQNRTKLFQWNKLFHYNKKCSVRTKSKIRSVGSNCFSRIKKCSVITKNKICSVGSNLIIGTKKCFYWN